METNKIYQGDCLELMKQIEDNSIDLVVTDPPYNENYNYDGYKDFREDYYTFLEEVIIELKRVLKEGGSIYLKHSSKQIDKVFPLLLKHFNFVNLICWLNQSQGHPNLNYESSFEPIYFFSKGDVRVFNKLAEQRPKPKGWWATSYKDYVGLIGNVWFDIKARKGGCVNKMSEERSKDNNFKLHPCSMPIELARRCINFSSKEGDIVLDCFIGSGTTAVACKQTNRRFIGMELVEKYVNICRRRLSQQTLTKLGGFL